MATHTSLFFDHDNQSSDMDSHFLHGGPYHLSETNTPVDMPDLSIRSAYAATKILSHVLPRLTHVMTKSGLPPTLLLQAIPPLQQKSNISFLGACLPLLGHFVVSFYMTKTSSNKNIYWHV